VAWAASPPMPHPQEQIWQQLLHGQIVDRLESGW
jgi:hypothetical protein